MLLQCVHSLRASSGHRMSINVLGAPSAYASETIKGRVAHPVSITNADEFFEDLHSKFTTLDELSRQKPTRRNRASLSDPRAFGRDISIFGNKCKPVISTGR